MLISNTQAMLEMLQRIEGCRALAIDTEFMRDKTYYPLLCLVQMASDDVEFVLDPLSIGDLSPLADILTDPRTVKIFHAGSQDRELLFHNCGVATSPVFDIQTAAPLLGMSQQVGYATAVQELCGVKLKKLDSLTDWTLRPLSMSQLKYSLEDVRYLIPMYDQLSSKLKDMGRLHWLDDEFARMSDPKIFERPESELWHKVKKSNSLPRSQLIHVSNIAIWREKIAKRRNIPRKWVLPDELLVEISRVEPQTVEELYRIRGTREKLNKTMAQNLVHIIERGKKSDPSTWPSKGKRVHTPVGADAISDVLMGLVRLRARENNIAPQVLATHDDLMSLASGKREKLDLLRGWRFELVGRELLSFLDGGETLRIVDGTLTAERLLGS